MESTRTDTRAKLQMAAAAAVPASVVRSKAPKMVRLDSAIITHLSLIRVPWKLRFFEVDIGVNCAKYTSRNCVWVALG